ncbi:GUN4 domain-containing protein [Dapis sp. BLCC M126]|uniref:GUN4 domain-containing protein n=1 Tax=Dapis sp. BLCC M126 TaxID=3400189 RepID=UPI003CEC71BC
MSSSLEESIVLISSSKKANVIGTGFAFYKVDNYTYLLTCAHVVEGVGGEENLLVNNIPAKVVATGDVNGFDLAVLGVEKLSIPLFQLISLSEAENQKFRIAGHYLYGENKNVMLETVDGTIGKKRFARQNNETVIAWNLLINEGERLRKGYSGAPVVDLSDRVLGVATNMENEGAEGLAISVEALNKIWPEIPVAISQQLKLKSEPLPEVELKSDVGCDYTELKKLLSEGEWKEADEKTARCMLQVAGREKEGWLRVEDIDKFPCIDLRTIDQLWVKYSDGKFGFSVQKEIYQSLGGTRKYNEKVWKAFGNKVEWRKGEKWLYYSKLTFSLDKHYVGHFPFWLVFLVYRGSWWFGRGVDCPLFSCTERCRL